MSTLTGTLFTRAYVVFRPPCCPRVSRQPSDFEYRDKAVVEIVSERSRLWISELFNY